MRAVLLCTLLLPGMAMAEIYKWTDAQGQVHFDQRSVAGATPVTVKPQVIESDEATRQRQQRTDNFYKARRDEEAVAQQRESKAYAQQQQLCRRLRHQLGQIAAGPSYYSLDAKGERVYYSDQELDAARRQISQQIAQDCD
ncbi:DUF4124 domain-containing protein [Pseudomonas turukhanskensis]|uniref:DUF4124 domain-containing protein n=1 Tax=Pseudomonas turukhanskensis TaxID=1806536 RepID=A0A9W6NID9_9PSED|nr:DUF4124 domain-containing protein [Pseudomonas turukhanskensis]GLK91812.1 hypothetical protein GCM10017655_48760 [Pseudomonas turukhanskensis]